MSKCLYFPLMKLDDDNKLENITAISLEHVIYI